MHDMISTFREITLQHLDFYSRTSIDGAILRHTKVDVHRSMISDSIDVFVRMTVAGQNNVEVDETFPLTWWDAVKDRWYPEWAKRRWPPQYRHILVNCATVFPSIALPERYGPVRVILTDSSRNFSYLPDDDAS